MLFLSFALDTNGVLGLLAEQFAENLSTLHRDHNYKDRTKTTRSHPVSIGRDTLEQRQSPAW